MKKIKVVEFNNWKDKIKRSDSFLDIGCWDGGLVNEITKNKICDAYGLDIDKDKLALADKKIKNRLKYADATKKIPFLKKFDWVIVSEVIEHVESDEKLLKNVSSALKSGGHLILTTPKSITSFQFWDPAWVRWKFGGPKHYHYTIQELDKKLKKYNLEIESYAIGGSLHWVFLRWISVIFRYGLKINMPLSCVERRDGFFDIKLIAKKVK